MPKRAEASMHADSHMHMATTELTGGPWVRLPFKGDNAHAQAGLTHAMLHALLAPGACAARQHTDNGKGRMALSRQTNR